MEIDTANSLSYERLRQLESMLSIFHMSFEEEVAHLGLQASGTDLPRSGVRALVLAELRYAMNDFKDFIICPVLTPLRLQKAFVIQRSAHLLRASLHLVLIVFALLFCKYLLG